MKILKVLTLSFLIFGMHKVALAQDNNEMYAIYLVRHAEKELSSDNPKDPPLTDCGAQRAESLKVFLEDVKLDAIYSTEYLRTMNTAEPTATKKGIKTQLYDSKKLEAFAKFLLDQKEDVLVVGHSNSTPALVGHLIGKELESMDESIYDRIYQVVIYQDSARLHVLHSSFVCQP